MKTSILQLLDDKPLRLVTSDESNAPVVEVQRVDEPPNAADHDGVRALLLSILLVLTTYWTFLQLLG